MNQISSIVPDGLWPEQPEKLTEEGLDRLLVWATELGASRINLQSNHQLALRVYGRVRKVTSRPLGPDEVELAVNRLYSGEGVARIKGGHPIDVAYEVQPDRHTRLRFRVNAVGVQGKGTGGIDIVLRPIPRLAPRLSEQRVEHGIADNFRPGNGMVMIAGATGSGKSTLIGGMIREKLEDPDGNYDIIEGAAPVEFLYDQVSMPAATMSQCEIPRDVETFDEFIRACMRKEPTDIVVGECRDEATMRAAVQAAISGHMLLSTLHSNDIALSMQRMVSLCPPHERSSLTIAIAQSLRLLVNQRLAPSTDGKRTAIREFLVVDGTLRDRFLDTDPSTWPSLTRQALETKGESYPAAIKRAFGEGRINEAVAAQLMKDVT